MKRFALAAFCTVSLVSYVLAEDITAVITKVENNKITYFKTEAAAGGKKAGGKGKKGGGGALEKKGDAITGTWPLGSGTQQQLGAAVTYARRYCLCAVTGIAPDEDDDDGQTTNPAEAIIGRVRSGRASGVASGEYGSGMPGAPADLASVDRGSQGDRDVVAGEPTQAGRHGDGGNPPGPVGLAAEERPGSIDGRQRTRLLLCMRDLGVEDQKERIDQWSELAGRPLASSNDLSWSEAAGLLRHYEPLAAEKRKEAGKL